MPPITGANLPGIDPDLASKLGSAQAVDALKRGDIQEVLKLSGVSLSDLLEFAKSQSIKLHEIVDPAQIYSMEASLPSPQWGPEFSPEIGLGALSSEDHEQFKGLLKKAIGKASDEGSSSLPPSLEGLAEGYVEQADSLLNTMADKALENQLQLQFAKRSAELKKQFLNLIANAKDPETVLLALTQYTNKYAGLISAQAGVRIGMQQRASVRLTDQLAAISTKDPKFYAKSEQIKQQLQTGSQNIQQQMALIQSSAQNMEAAISFGQSAIGKINENQTRIIQNMGK